MRRLRLAIRRVFIRQPLLELGHVVCPIIPGRRCPCLWGAEL